MQLKTFTVPFSEIVPADALELEFAETDFVVVRPIFSQPVSEIRGLQDRLNRLGPDTSDAEADQLVLDLLAQAIVKWSLDINGEPREMPRTPAELNALPGAVRGALYPFLTNFRGRGPNPTPAG